jgi:predicted Zn finger-like uncharacterized protein
MMQCPRCSTRWRVAAASPVENPLFKCGRCHHLFRQFPGAPPPGENAPASASGRRAAAAPEAPDTLEFIFPERQPAEILRADDPPLIIPSPVAERLDPGLASGAPEVSAPEPTTIVAVAAAPSMEATVVANAAGSAFRDADPAGEDSEDEADDEHELGRDLLAEPADDDDPVLGDIDEDDMPARPDAGRSFRVEETMKAPAGFGTIMRALGVAVTGFAALALVVRVAPERTSTWLSRLPIAGAGFAHDRNLARKVELRNVQGKFQRLRNARRVFVISGDARNNSPMTIERIEVAGALYGLGGGELDQKVVTTGNRTALTDLSEAEIVLLQRLDPAIALAPGETTPFLIVFLEPPRELREFSSRVLSVRPTRRASTPPRSHRDSVG